MTDAIAKGTNFGQGLRVRNIFRLNLFNLIVAVNSSGSYNCSYNSHGPYDLYESYDDGSTAPINLTVTVTARSAASRLGRWLNLRQRPPRWIVGMSTGWLHSGRIAMWTHNITVTEPKHDPSLTALLVLAERKQVTKEKKSGAHTN